MSDDPLQSPGGALQKMLDMKEWNQSVLASVLNKPASYINRVIHGKATITAEVAKGLATVFGTDAEFWLTLESQRQLSEVGDDDELAIRRRSICYDLAPIKEIQKRGWIKETAVADDLVSEMQSFFMQQDLAQPIKVLASFRRSTDHDDTEMSPAQRAWCFRALHVAKKIATPKYDESRLSECAKKLRELAAHRPEARNVSACLLECGIRFVIVEHLPTTKIDGCTFWIDDESPVIAVTTRKDQIDSFWFTVFHELSHVKHRDAFSLDNDLFGTDTSIPGVAKSPVERRADLEAAQFLVDQTQLESFVKRVRPLYSRTRIVQFSHKVKIHPGVVVGQLQHRGEVGFHAHKEFLVKIRDVVTPTSVTDGWGHSLS